MTYKLFHNVKNDGSNNSGSSKTDNMPPDRATTSTPSETIGSDVEGGDTELVRQGRSQIYHKYFSGDNKYFNVENDHSQEWGGLALRLVPDPGARCYKKRRGQLSLILEAPTYPA
ncbi:hypothetical protein F5144DRAFT_586123 [Chaetomium tenue]|uniref:Uncharacterized protein n=1 Tax=Chaetomium tenue TaxID=1854479 RepID=A0ACB7NX07_9PEZI|nr:hypothetical protein F5144DRAFT_586123 [Chaetomium globosum]